MLLKQLFTKTTFQKLIPLISPLMIDLQFRKNFVHFEVFVVEKKNGKV